MRKSHLILDTFCHQRHYAFKSVINHGFFVFAFFPGTQGAFCCCLGACSYGRQAGFVMVMASKMTIESVMIIVSTILYTGKGYSRINGYQRIEDVDFCNGFLLFKF